MGLDRYPLACIGQERNYTLSCVFWAFLQAQARRVQRSSRGYSGEDALARGKKLSAGSIRLLIGNGDDLVINALVKRLGYKVCTYALKSVRGLHGLPTATGRS